MSSSVFREHELAIERLVRTSTSFRSMCEDYAVGVEALQRWESVIEPQDSAMIAELRASVADLEQELLEALEQEVVPLR